MTAADDPRQATLLPSGLILGRLDTYTDANLDRLHRTDLARVAESLGTDPDELWVTRRWGNKLNQEPRSVWSKARLRELIALELAHVEAAR